MLNVETKKKKVKNPSNFIFFRRLSKLPLFEQTWRLLKMAALLLVDFIKRYRPEMSSLKAKKEKKNASRYAFIFSQKVPGGGGEMRGCSNLLQKIAYKRQQRSGR